jgi:hypothetical protein
VSPRASLLGSSWPPAGGDVPTANRRDGWERRNGTNIPESSQAIVPERLGCPKPTTPSDDRP